MRIGQKVLLRNREESGWGNLARIDENLGLADVEFFTSAVSCTVFQTPLEAVRRAPLPTETRCYQTQDGVTRYGRVLSCIDDQNSFCQYWVRFAGEEHPTVVPENEFNVRSYLAGDDPIDVLANLANETPFFFEHRFGFLRELLFQTQSCFGLPALLSSKIEVLQHQAEIASRVLSDMTIRYMLADEVGLGKTIEAGIILRQLSLDAPKIRIGIAVPEALVGQWTEEMLGRFGLDRVEVFPHSDIGEQSQSPDNWDVLVIDEAHRVVARDPLNDTPLSRGARKLAGRAVHLLLLSATPVLHHDADLLALLELLDPANYSRADLASFQRRTAKRVELGRALLALRSASAPALFKRSADALTRLLPDDATLREIVAHIAEPNADFPDLKRALHSHISETYRIHRRMLRTRRRWLADSEKRFVRDVEEDVEYELDEELHGRMWGILEEWRTELAARVGSNADLRAICSEEYVRLAEVIASDPGRLRELTSEVSDRTNAMEVERSLLLRLSEEAPVQELIAARLDLLKTILSRRIKRDGAHAKYVIFCPSPVLCVDLAKLLLPHLPPRSICVADSSLSRRKAGDRIAMFGENHEMRVLITDAVGEEGFNLQFARALLFYDLPWSPMRLEQRIGRLDRIDRAGRIACIVISTNEDDTIAVDEAWRRVISEGFGLFDASVSDLQHLIDTELPRLRECAFIGGPTALLAECERLKRVVRIERETIEEQDVIDGVHFISSDSVLCRDLDAADNRADAFGEALTNYLRENIGLKQWWNEDDNSFTFRLPRDKDPIIPVECLQPLVGLFNEPFTVYRAVAIEDFSLQFLRPGHPSVDGCRDLLAWDDRGRAFAMWRQTQGFQNVRVIFRIIVHAKVDLFSVEELLDLSVWDEIRRGSLLRMVRGWFAEFMDEVFLDENGESAVAEIVKLCRRPYSKVDVNLGKERAEYIRSALGEKSWQKMSRSAGERAIELVKSGELLAKRRDAALSLAAEHFAMIRTRLAARAHLGIESGTTTKEADAEEKVAQSLIEQMLAHPTLRIDTIGAYFLSDKPFWEEKHWDS
jgi:ATP-dependent helicase HepA